jgi:hypothetical protein
LDAEIFRFFNNNQQEKVSSFCVMNNAVVASTHGKTEKTKDPPQK